MKKFLSMMLALILVVSMSTITFAANQDASFSKTYRIENEDTSNPEETFTFTFTADHVTDSNKNLQTANMPAIPDSSITYNSGEANKDGSNKTVSVALADVKWPGVGVYYYNVKEVKGKTAGVTYDEKTATLKVTVAYDEGTNTYYTAFVTLSTADENNDGITDSKTAGFDNKYSAGSLGITKKVTGNMGDKEAYFNVKVTLNGEAGKTYLSSYNVTGGSEDSNPTTIKIGEAADFKLKNGDTITISNLPYGVTYTVEEDDYTSAANGGYDAANYSFSDANKTIDTAADTVEITNNKGITVDTGINMDSMPYILMLAVVCMGLFGFFFKKRMMRED